MVLEILLVIAVLWAGTTTYSSWNLLKKNERYEDWVVSLARQVNTAYQRMRTIDANQIFEKDDEVGATFEDLKNVVYELQSFTLEKDDESDET
jgi:hypothetical protein